MRHVRNTSGSDMSASRTSASMTPWRTSDSGVSWTTKAGSCPSISSTVATARVDALYRSMWALWRIRNSHAWGFVPGRYVERPPGPEEGFLDQVLGVLAPPRQPQRGPVERVQVRGDHLLEQRGLWRCLGGRRPEPARVYRQLRFDDCSYPPRSVLHDPFTCFPGASRGSRLRR